jgi:hypothetical protein
LKGEIRRRNSFESKTTSRKRTIPTIH